MIIAYLQTDSWKRWADEEFAEIQVRYVDFVLRLVRTLMTYLSVNWSKKSR
jgi:hypothetical protein